MKPPWLWRSLLAVLLPARSRTYVLDDLDEELRRRAVGDPGAARRWYRREALRGIGPALKLRLRGLPRPSGERRSPADRPTATRTAGRVPLEWLLVDLGLAVRNLRARRGYLVLTVITLAVAIAGSTVVFGVIHSMAFSTLPYRDAERLVMVYERSLDDVETNRILAAPAKYLDWQRELTSFEQLAAYRRESPVFVGEAEADRLQGLLATENLFEALGVEASLGRVFTEADVRDGADVVVISDGFWERAFARDSEILGREITLAGTPMTVIGIMPPEFRFPYMYPIDTWRPLTFSPEEASDRSFSSLFVIGRLRDGVSLESARAEGDAIAEALADQYPDSNGGRGIHVIEHRDYWLEGLSSLLIAFGVAAAIGIGIACLNLTGLMLGRGLTRGSEIAARRALGASGGRIASLLLAEAAVVAVLGAGLGAALAAAVLPRFGVGLSYDVGRLLYEDASVNVWVLSAAAGLAALVVAAASLPPLIQCGTSDIHDRLRGVVGSTRGPERRRLQRALIVGQMVLALVLLGQAGVLMHSVYNAYHQDLGFDHRSVLKGRVSPNPGDADVAGFYRSAREAAAALPGVSGATLASLPPFSVGASWVAATVDGSSPSAVIEADDVDRSAQIRFVGGEYFDVLGIPTLQGRTLGPRDVAGGELVAVVNERFARTFLGGGDPVGRPLRVAMYYGRSRDGFDMERRLVGVVGDVAERGTWGEDPIVYLPYEQEPPAAAMTVMLRTTVPPETMADPLKETVWQLGSRVPVTFLGTLEASMGETLYSSLDFIAGVLAWFAGGALVLAAIGLYGVTAFDVRDRAREISIRVALGARTSQVVTAVVREGFALAAVGASAGAILLAVFGPELSGWYVGMFVFDVPRFDWVTVGGAAAFLMLAAVSACVGPARTAARVDPAQPLKSE